MKSFSILAASFCLLISSQAFAGASNAGINCKSADGLTLTGNIPGDFAEFDVTIRQADKSSRVYSLTNQKTGQLEGNGTATAVQSLKDGVYTITINRESPSHGFIEMFAIPKTVVFKSVSGGYTATFSAKLSFRLFSDDIVDKTVQCTMKYSI
jgi:hypothetical protein